jgi:hypothetical protein
MPKRNSHRAARRIAKRAARMHFCPAPPMHFLSAVDRRFRVREISLREEALAHFEKEPILEAAGLLADARPRLRLCRRGSRARTIP